MEHRKCLTTLEVQAILESLNNEDVEDKGTSLDALNVIYIKVDNISN